MFAVIGHGENNGFIIQQHLDFSHYFFMLPFPQQFRIVIFIERAVKIRFLCSCHRLISMIITIIIAQSFQLKSLLNGGKNCSLYFQKKISFHWDTRKKIINLHHKDVTKFFCDNNSRTFPYKIFYNRLFFCV